MSVCKIDELISNALVASLTKPKKGQISLKRSAQWCVLTISSPLGVGQAPVENSWGTYKIKNIAQKKLA